MVDGAQPETSLESPLDNLLGFEHAPRTDKPRAAAATKAEDSHADLDASSSFKCASPAQPRGMDAALMPAFAGLRNRSVQVVGPKSQSATLSAPGRRTISG